MHHPIVENSLKNEHIQATLLSAREYCACLERIGVQHYTQDDFIDLLHVRLTELYSKVILIPKVEEILGDQEVSDKEGPERRGIDKELYSQLSGILDKYTDYSQSFDPTIMDDPKNHSHGWLVDDLANIYKDLKDVLAYIDRDTDESIQHGLWLLKFGFSSHWGDHLINALRFLHYVKYWHLYKHLE